MKKKRINTAAKGARLERKVIEIMTKDGYSCTRSAASKGVFDVICMREDSIICVQVKANSKPSKKEMDTIRDLRLPDVCRKQVYIFKDGRPNEPDIIEIRSGAASFDNEREQALFE